MTMRAIIAENNPFTRRALLGVLKRTSQEEEVEVEIDEVSNGRELVEKVSKNNYHLILTDCGMLGADGLSTIRKIRGYDEAVPIYMLSWRNIPEEALEAGATKFFYKGAGPGEIIEDVRNAIVNHSRN